MNKWWKRRLKKDIQTTENVPELPERYRQMVRKIGANHPDRGGKKRETVAEFIAHLIWSQEKIADATQKYIRSSNRTSWVLAIATVSLVIVGLVQWIC